MVLPSGNPSIARFRFAEFRQIIHEIRDGSFAQDLLGEQRNNYPRLRAMSEAARGHDLTGTEARLRQLLKLPL
jgi:ketol-acid reductoisomerase